MHHTSCVTQQICELAAAAEVAVSQHATHTMHDLERYIAKNGYVQLLELLLQNILLSVSEHCSCITQYACLCTSVWATQRALCM
jgi:hypothetical protein